MNQRRIIWAIAVCVFYGVPLSANAQSPATATKVPVPPTVMHTDREFLGGSGVKVSALTDIQVTNLAALAEVWGFLKYHDPIVASGKKQWDFELFRVMPAVLAARNVKEGNSKLVEWIDALGPVLPCSPCAQLDVSKVKLAPDLAWTEDESRWGRVLAGKLKTIYVNRSTGAQFYVAKRTMGAANPDFLHEDLYETAPFPDAGYQLLTLFRWWSAYEWWYPNRDLLPEFRATLRSYIRPMALAKSKEDFVLETFRLVGEAHDTHANLWNQIDTHRPPVGSCAVDASFRWVEGKAVVWTSFSAGSGLQRGDVLENVGGQSVAALIAAWRPFYADSNEAARSRDLMQEITGGDCGPVKLGVRRAGVATTVESTRVKGVFAKMSVHDRDGDAVQKLSPDVAYLKLSEVKIADAKSYIERAAGMKGLIIDIRNYPSQFVVFALGNLLSVPEKAKFFEFSIMDEANPGAFSLEKDLPLHPAEPHYKGRIAILVDEATQSQAEYTAMAFRVAPGAAVVGSQTAGADGNVSNIPLPYGMSTLMSGIGIFTPSGGQTQGIGIARDIEAAPTVSGIAAGRDEVLEAGVKWVLGDSAAESEIVRISHR